jgi:hypothetical protein
MSPGVEPQTVRDCAALQRECAARQSEERDKMHEKMNQQHSELVTEMSGIRIALTTLAASQASGRLELKDEIIAQEAARVAAREAVRIAMEAVNQGDSFWRNPIVTSVLSAVLTAAIMGGLAAYFLGGGK